MNNREWDERFLQDEYETIRSHGYALAGGLNDLAQRASVYYHLYEDSGGRNVFPLIAAHGALWARGFLRNGARAGCLLASFFSPAKWYARHVLMRRFADDFLDINRRVCAEAYCAYHFTKLYGDTALARRLLPAGLLALLNQCHSARERGAPFPPENRRQLFEAFFLWEQENIASPAVAAAMARFDWPLAKWFAMRPKIEFAYFARGKGLRFSDFSSQSERIAHGLMAYDLAEQAGFRKVEAALTLYAIMPRRFFDNTRAHYARLRSEVLALGARPRA